MKPARSLPLFLFASLCVLCGHSFAAAAPAPAALPPDHAARMTRGLELFRTDIAPLLREHCVKCHGGEKTRNDFDLTTREGLLRGGSEGSAVTPFNERHRWSGAVFSYSSAETQVLGLVLAKLPRVPSPLMGAACTSASQVPPSNPPITYR